MSLSVLVKSASGLPNVEKFSKSDPMCVITLEGRTTLPESCVYGPYQHFVLMPSRCSSHHTTDLRVFCSMVLRGPVNDLLAVGCNPLSHLFSLSLYPFLFLLFAGEKKKTKVIDNNLDPEWNEVGSAISCCRCSPNCLVCFTFHFLSFHKILTVIPSLSVSHTCTNADFELELAGSSQWLGGAQGGGL